ncbi:hypothetical protein WJX73_010838 [Symbiochloris irregularis]|uniref:Secreted protein n=1 Tax=Symbiochloris irregularis TaxID=706552 RepID=A0AAW1NPL4_9CHLO
MLTGLLLCSFPATITQPTCSPQDFTSNRRSKFSVALPIEPSCCPWETLSMKGACCRLDHYFKNSSQAIAALPISLMRVPLLQAVPSS